MLNGIDALTQRWLGRRLWTLSSLWLVLLLVSPATMAEPKRSVIDAEHVSVAFLVEHIGNPYVMGVSARWR